MADRGLLEYAVRRHPGMDPVRLAVTANQLYRAETGVPMTMDDLARVAVPVDDGSPRFGFIGAWDEVMDAAAEALTSGPQAGLWARYAAIRHRQDNDAVAILNNVR